MALKKGFIDILKKYHSMGFAHANIRPENLAFSQAGWSYLPYLSNFFPNVLVDSDFYKMYEFERNKDYLPSDIR